MAGNTHWKPSELARLRDHYPNISVHRLKEAFPERSLRSITGKARREGIKKSPERMSEMGRENCIPFNQQSRDRPGAA